ncbi:MAG: hypothetical protein GWP16_05335, partial [Nitrospirae bacterium]|nr:hypothetical protein [Nitrospirota bacterium]
GEVDDHVHLLLYPLDVLLHQRVWVAAVSLASQWVLGVEAANAQELAQHREELIAMLGTPAD